MVTEASQHGRKAVGRVRWRTLLFVGLAYLAGLVSQPWAPRVSAHQPASRFVNMGNDGPFRMWKDTRTDQCFIVTTPSYSMLAVGAC